MEPTNPPPSQLTRTAYSNNCGTKRALARIRRAAKEVTLYAGDRGHPLHKALACGADVNVLLRGEKYILAPIRCGKKFCDTCAKHWSEDMQSALLPLALAVKDGDLRHLTITVPNAPHTRLAMRLDQLKHSWREWRNQGRKQGWWDVAGYHHKYEIDWGQRKGWHPHIHCLIDAPKGVELRRGSPAREAWTRITEKAGCRAVAIFITRPKGNTKVREVAKYCAKPKQVAAMPSQHLRELSEALHKRRLHSSEGTLHPPPEKPAPSEYEYLGRLSVLLRSGSDHLPEIGAFIARDLRRTIDELSHIPSVAEALNYIP